MSVLACIMGNSVTYWHHCIERSDCSETVELAKRKKLVTDIPHIQLFQERNARQGFFEREELEALVVSLPPYLKDVARFAYHTGWRKEEIFTLEWGDIQGDTIRLRPEIAKNKDGRVILLVGEIARIIAQSQVKRSASCPYVFHREGKRIISHYRAWYKACAQVGLVGRHLHDTRWTAARNMDRAGVPRQVAK
jgi:integrase